MRTVVIGGGIIGWLAGWLCPRATILDWRRPPPKGTMHVPRFMGPMYLHQPLEGLSAAKFMVHTTIDGMPANWDRALAYKTKIGKADDMESSTWKEQFPRLFPGYKLTEWPAVTVSYGCTVSFIDALNRRVQYVGPDKSIISLQYDVLISTIPLPSLLEYLRWPGAFVSTFTAKPIAMRAAPSPPDTPSHIRNDPTNMYVDYQSREDSPIYRVTDFERMRYYEWLYRPKEEFVGIPTRVIRPGKLYPHADTSRILMDLRTIGIYPFGRAGRWAPNELIHESYTDMVQTLLNLGA